MSIQRYARMLCPLSGAASGGMLDWRVSEMIRPAARRVGTTYGGTYAQ
jgi:hypothetical protein